MTIDQFQQTVAVVAAKLNAAPVWFDDRTAIVAEAELELTLGGVCMYANRFEYQYPIPHLACYPSEEREVVDKLVCDILQHRIDRRIRGFDSAHFAELK